MSRDRNGQTESARPKRLRPKRLRRKRSEGNGQTETARWKRPDGNGQTETARPKRPDRKVLFRVNKHCLSYNDAVQYLRSLTKTATKKKVGLLQIQWRFSKDETYRTKVNAQD